MKVFWLVDYLNISFCFLEFVYVLLDKYRVELSRKSVKPPFCCTVSILQVYFTHLFIETNFLKIIEFSPNQFSRDNLSCISQDNFCINFMKRRNCNRYVLSRDYTTLLWCTAYNLWTFTWFVHFKCLFRLKGAKQIQTEGNSYFSSILISVLWLFWSLKYLNIFSSYQMYYFGPWVRTYLCFLNLNPGVSLIYSGVPGSK